jgi:hypothetical protein
VPEKEQSDKPPEQNKEGLFFVSDSESEEEKGKEKEKEKEDCSVFDGTI